MELSGQKKQGHLHIILLAVIIIVQCIFYTYIFVEKKTAYHEDEYFSYALSNSYMHPFLYGSDLLVCDGYDVWRTGDDFKYYIRTNDDTKFAYDSVWSNLKHDTNPPFYYAILHTISSFFSGDFSWWYAFSINLVCFVVSQIFLYLLVIQLCRSRNTALIICAFRAFTIAAQADNLFLRMYAMLTMFGIMYAYFSLKVLLEEKPKRSSLIAVGIIAFFGSMTQHLFLVYIFLLTAIECLFILIQKKWKKFFLYGCSAALGVLLSFAAFPAAYQHLFHSKYPLSHEPDTMLQSYILTHLMLTSTFGVPLVKIKTILFWTKVGMIFIIPIFLPILFLFRKKLPSAARKTVSFLKKTGSKGKKYLPQLLILLVPTVIFLFIVSSKFYYDDWGQDSVRYVFLIIPLLTAVIISGIMLIVKMINVKVIRRIIYGLLSVCLVFSLFWQNRNYEPRYILSAEPENGSIAEYVKGNDCILLPLTQIYMPIYSKMFEDAGDVYETILEHDYYRKDNHIAEYQKLFDKQQPFMLVFDGTTLLTEEYYENVENSEGESMKKINLKRYGPNWTKERIIAYFEEISGYTAEYCTAESTHLNRIYAYRMVPDSEKQQESKKSS